jgi:hypothetical protein
VYEAEGDGAPAGGGDLRCVETGLGIRDVGGGCEWCLGSEGETVAVFCFVVPRGAKSRGGMDGRLGLAGCLYWHGLSLPGRGFS